MSNWLPDLGFNFPVNLLSGIIKTLDFHELYRIDFKTFQTLEATRDMKRLAAEVCSLIS